MSSPESRDRTGSDSLDEAQVRPRLSALSFMRDCGRAADAVTDAFVSLSEIVEVEDDHLLLREGDVRGTEGYVLLEGRVSVIRSGREPIPVAAPALLGEMQQFSISGSRSASVLTEGACTLLLFDWPAFYAQLEANLRPLDYQRVKDAIRRYSWNHVLDADAD